MSWIQKLRLSWVLMIAIAVISLVGANHIMNTPRQPGLPNREAAGGVDKSASSNVQRNPARPVASGIVVPENDIVPLIPSIKGEVAHVYVKNDQVVKKGDVLLKMDDRQARIKMKRAEHGVKAAELLLQKANRGMQEWEMERKVQEGKIALAKKDYEKAYEQARKLKKAFDDKLVQEVEWTIAFKTAEQANLTVSLAEDGLRLIDAKKPSLETEQAKLGIEDAQAQLEEAKLFVDACDLKAPAAGTILQSYVSAGSKFGDQGVKPAFLFYEGGLIVKAKVVQEWAFRIKEGQAATVYDSGGSGQAWKGKVVYVAKAFMPDREVGVLEGVNILPQNQELVLECRIALDPGQPTPFVNQKVRVTFGD